MNILSLDSPPTNDELLENALLASNINQQSLSILQERISGDHSQDFYLGMITGIKAVLELQQSSNDIRYPLRLQYLLSLVAVNQKSGNL